VIRRLIDMLVFYCDFFVSLVLSLQYAAAPGGVFAVVCVEHFVCRLGVLYRHRRPWGRQGGYVPPKILEKNIFSGKYVKFRHFQTKKSCKIREFCYFFLKNVKIWVIR